MTLDEAIKHCLKVAEESEYSAIMFKQKKEASAFLEKAEAEKAENDCKQRATDHRQLAEWLTELKEARRILKLAVEDLSTMPCNNDTHSPDSCYICVKHGNCSYTDSFKWCRTDIALKLIGGSENG